MRPHDAALCAEEDTAAHYAAIMQARQRALCSLHPSFAVVPRIATVRKVCVARAWR
jgi:hypothetical protein